MFTSCIILLVRLTYPGPRSRWGYYRHCCPWPATLRSRISPLHWFLFRAISLHISNHSLSHTFKVILGGLTWLFSSSLTIFLHVWHIYSLCSSLGASWNVIYSINRKKRDPVSREHADNEIDRSVHENGGDSLPTGDNKRCCYEDHGMQTIMWGRSFEVLLLFSS